LRKLYLLAQRLSCLGHEAALVLAQRLSSLGTDRARGREAVRRGVGGGGGAWRKVCTERPQFVRACVGEHGRTLSAVEVSSAAQLQAAHALLGVSVQLALASCACLLAMCRGGCVTWMLPSSLGRDRAATGEGVGGKGVLTGVTSRCSGTLGEAPGDTIMSADAVGVRKAPTTLASGWAAHGDSAPEAPLPLPSPVHDEAEETLSKRLLRLRGAAAPSGAEN